MAAAAAVFAALGPCTPLPAADTPIRPDYGAAPPPEGRVSFFAGGDATSASYSLWAGIAGAPHGLLHEDGARFRVTGGAGRYRYRTKAVAGGVNEGTVTSGEILYGYRRSFGDATLTLHAGGHVESHRLRAPDPGHRTQGTALGVKATLEFFHRLDPDLYLTASASASTVHRAYHARAALVREHDARIAYGIEAALNGNTRYREPRAGLLVQAHRGRTILSLSAGYLWNSDRGAGPFATLSLYAPY